MVDSDPETWRWIWLTASLVFLGGEMVVPGTFFLLPFGISAAIAVVLAFAGVPVAIEFIVFIVAGAALFIWFFQVVPQVRQREQDPDRCRCRSTGW